MIKEGEVGDEIQKIKICGYQPTDEAVKRRGELRWNLKRHWPHSMEEFLHLTCEFKDVIENYWKEQQTCPHCGKFI